MSFLDSDYGKKMFAFSALVCINVSLLLIVTLSKSSGKAYTYNPTSAICIAEIIKFSISSAQYLQTNTFADARAHLNRNMLISYAILAIIYCVNNQITFLVLGLTAPGNLSLFKATTPFLTAVMNYLVFNVQMNKLEISCVIMLTCGLLLTQWNDCTGHLNISPVAFFALLFSCVLTVFSSVLNARVIKTLDTPLPVQNMTLYSMGAVLNFQAFILSYSGFLYGSNQAGFFDGYDNIYAIGVVLMNGLIGVAITFVYKYGDAVIKCFATVLSSMILVIVSVLFFGQIATVSSMSGTIIVFTASYLYMLVAPELNKLDTNKSISVKDIEMASEKDVDSSETENLLHDSKKNVSV
jgi:drug/metabolite transporter (DMT)-like permease